MLKWCCRASYIPRRSYASRPKSGEELRLSVYDTLTPCEQLIEPVARESRIAEIFCKKICQELLQHHANIFTYNNIRNQHMNYFARYFLPYD